MCLGRALVFSFGSNSHTQALWRQSSKYPTILQGNFFILYIFTCSIYFWILVWFLRVRSASIVGIFYLDGSKGWSTQNRPQTRCMHLSYFNIVLFELSMTRNFGIALCIAQGRPNLSFLHPSDAIKDNAKIKPFHSNRCIFFCKFSCSPLLPSIIFSRNFYSFAFNNTKN